MLALFLTDADELFSEILPVLFSCLMFNLWSFLLPILSLNSIAYRRVICVYQYQVADDLSGRSRSLESCFFFIFNYFLTHATLLKLCDLIHLNLKKHHVGLQCAQNRPAVLTTTQFSNSKHRAAVSASLVQWTGKPSPCLQSVPQGRKLHHTIIHCT